MTDLEAKGNWVSTVDLLNQLREERDALREGYAKVRIQVESLNFDSRFDILLASLTADKEQP